jgi:hypothetical protein
MPLSHSSYLMRHSSGRFAACHNLVFCLFDQLQRHAACTQAAARVRGDAPSMQAFTSMVSEDGFAARLAAACADPSAQGSKNLARRLGSVLQLTASKVPFSREARTAVLSRLYALTQLHGSPAVFLTFAPSELSSAMIVRLHQPCDSPDATDDEVRVLFELPTRPERFQLVQEDPVACAQWFNGLVTTLFSTMLGLPLTGSTRKSDVPLCARGHGALGVPVAFLNVIETQLRGAVLVCNAVVCVRACVRVHECWHAR